MRLEREALLAEKFRLANEKASLTGKMNALTSLLTISLLCMTTLNTMSMNDMYMLGLLSVLPKIRQEEKGEDVDRFCYEGSVTLLTDKSYYLVSER